MLSSHSEQTGLTNHNQHKLFSYTLLQKWKESIDIWFIEICIFIIWQKVDEKIDTTLTPQRHLLIISNTKQQVSLA